ncbi:MAG: hypothetical protein IKM38_06135 [Christensenellaceae bacterium]|nr:hypothetical protein [Christensenellaceae bacterium]
MPNEKLYVEVIVRFDTVGNVIPKEIVWNDGRHFSIDRILDVRQAASLKAGGQGDRYTIRIGGQLRYLFFERSAERTGRTLGKWFITAA